MKAESDRARADEKTAHDAEMAKAQNRSQLAHVRADAAAASALAKVKADAEATAADEQSKHHAALMDASKQAAAAQAEHVRHLAEAHDREVNERQDAARRADLARIMGPMMNPEMAQQLLPALMSCFQPVAAAQPSLPTQQLLLPPPPPLDAQEALPPGWERVTDVQGRTYYQNLTTKTTQWALPVAQDDGPIVLPPPSGEPSA